jgi:hypothetical protein
MDGTYNTGPWNAVGDTPGSLGNNSIEGQNAAESIGQQYASAYGFSPGSGVQDTGPAITGVPGGWSGSIPQSSVAPDMAGPADPAGQSGNWLSPSPDQTPPNPYGGLDTNSGQFGSAPSNSPFDLGGPSQHAPELPGALGDPAGVGAGTPPDLSMMPHGLDVGGLIGGAAPGAAANIPGASILGAPAAASGQQGQDFTGQGPPVEITNISAEGSVGQKEIAKQTAAVATATGKAAQITAQQEQLSTQENLTGQTNLTASIEQGSTNLFIRAGFVLLAVALLIGAFMLLSKGVVEKQAKAVFA